MERRGGPSGPPSPRLHPSEREALCERACALWRNGRHKQAFQLFRAAAEMGDASAQVNVGYCFDVGKGVGKNISRAMHWYKRASRRGASSGAHNIGIIYRDKGDLAKARRWFLRAVGKRDFSSAIDVAKIDLARGHSATAGQFLALALSHAEWLSEADIEEAEKLLRAVKAKPMRHLDRKAKSSVSLSL